MWQTRVSNFETQIVDILTSKQSLIMLVLQIWDSPQPNYWIPHSFLKKIKKEKTQLGFKEHRNFFINY